MIKNIFTILFIFVFAFSILYFTNLSSQEIILDKTIFSVIPVLIGMTIAVIGIFLSSLNNLNLTLYKILKNKEHVIFSSDDYDKIRKSIDDIVEELKHNAIFSLSSFILSLLFYYWKYMDFPYCRWFVDDSIFSKNQAINMLIFVLMGFILWAIYDSLYALFAINKSFALVKSEENK